MPGAPGLLSNSTNVAAPVKDYEHQEYPKYLPDIALTARDAAHEAQLREVRAPDPEEITAKETIPEGAE